MVLQIYKNLELSKGYIPSDKVHHNGRPYEIFGLANFGVDYDYFKKEWNKVKFISSERNVLIKNLISKIKSSKTYKEIEAEGYHKSLYLNFNNDGVDSFIER